MARIRDLRIGTRLGLGFFVVLFLLVVNTLIGLYCLQTVSQDARRMMDLPLAKERMLADWNRFVYAGIRRTTAIAKSSDHSLAAFFAKDAAASTAASQDLAKKIEALAETAPERALLQELAGVRKQYLDARTRIAQAQDAQQQAEADRVLEQEYMPAANSYETAVQKLLDYQREQMDTMAANNEALAARSRTILVALVVISACFGFGFSRWLTAGITRPIGQAVAVARKVAQGNLREDAGDAADTAKDETGMLLRSLIDMKGNLARIVAEMRSRADTISSASTQIAAGNTDLSARTEHQASSLQETAASMEELTGTVRQNSENARQANQLALSASDVAARGGSLVNQVVDTMGTISESSARIGEIIAVIEGIAFQTNILALNAAVEAARAGEQGRGFAVVAQEVRSLAQRSGSAAKEIKVLIDDSASKVAIGNDLVAQTGRTMEDVVGSIRRVTDIMAEVTAATHEQAAGIEQVNEAVSQMDHVTQQNAALVEQAAAAAGSLQDQASGLMQAAGRFQLA
ncbi:methyl-accepting chemotaxis protein [Cupriavidus sp. 30B13]|uniref:methyl-accepting chemotaxis protein n=1 Tax=Cupriavidus sp. 30B13 TaxID=3384241 RepID=UPI003B8F0DC0